MPNNLRDRQNNLLRMGPLWIAAIVSGILTSLAIAAERAPSEEERIAPLVTKQNCWGGVIKYVLQDRHFEVDEALCSDGGLYYLEFDEDLHLTAKRFVRKAGER